MSTCWALPTRGLFAFRMANEKESAIPSNEYDGAEDLTATASEQSMDLSGLLVEPIKSEIAAELVEDHHYLHTMPGNTYYCYGLIGPDEFSMPLGVVTYGPPSGRHAIPNLFEEATTHDALELSRLWVDDRAPKFSAGRLISRSLKQLPATTDRKIILTYCDGSRFDGTVFRATNWIRAGMTRGGRWQMWLDGKWYHPRAARNRWGTENVKFLKEVYGSRLRVEWVDEGKHVFIYLLGSKRERKQLRASLQPFS
ncbi:MAG: hypothetical protein ACOX9R_08520 [Armatimonadota bacterium]|jgi:hypothetical protein